jgi:hypothetical protein
MLSAAFVVLLALVASAFGTTENAYVCECQLTNRWFNNVNVVNENVTYVNGIMFYLNSSVPLGFETGTWNYNTNVANEYSCENLHYGSILSYQDAGYCGVDLAASDIQIDRNVVYCVDETGQGNQCFCEGSVDFLSILSGPILFSDDCRCIYPDSESTLMFCSSSSLQMSLLSVLALVLAYFH